MIYPYLNQTGFDILVCPMCGRFVSQPCVGCRIESEYITCSKCKIGWKRQNGKIVVRQKDGKMG